MESDDSKKYSFRMETEEYRKAKKKKTPKLKKLEDSILDVIPKEHHGRHLKK